MPLPPAQRTHGGTGCPIAEPARVTLARTARTSVRAGNGRDTIQDENGPEAVTRRTRDLSEGKAQSRWPVLHLLPRFPIPAQTPRSDHMGASPVERRCRAWGGAMPWRRRAPRAWTAATRGTCGAIVRRLVCPNDGIPRDHGCKVRTTRRCLLASGAREARNRAGRNSYPQSLPGARTAATAATLRGVRQEQPASAACGRTR